MNCRCYSSALSLCLLLLWILLLLLIITSLWLLSVVTTPCTVAATVTPPLTVATTHRTVTASPPSATLYRAQKRISNKGGEGGHPSARGNMEPHRGGNEFVDPFHANLYITPAVCTSEHRSRNAAKWDCWHHTQHNTLTYHVIQSYSHRWNPTSIQHQHLSQYIPPALNPISAMAIWHWNYVATHIWQQCHDEDVIWCKANRRQ